MFAFLMKKRVLFHHKGNKPTLSVKYKGKSVNYSTNSNLIWYAEVK